MSRIRWDGVPQYIFKSGTSEFLPRSDNDRRFRVLDESDSSEARALVDRWRERFPDVAHIFNAAQPFEELDEHRVMLSRDMRRFVRRIRRVHFKPRMRPIGDLWSCGMPGKHKYIALTQEAAYRMWAASR